MNDLQEQYQEAKAAVNNARANNFLLRGEKEAAKSAQARAKSEAAAAKADFEKKKAELFLSAANLQQKDDLHEDLVLHAMSGLTKSMSRVTLVRGLRDGTSNIMATAKGITSPDGLEELEMAYEDNVSSCLERSPRIILARIG